jgi:hypothetical protein
MRQEFRTGFLLALILLMVQLLLGMAVDLFVKVPLNHPGANPPEYFSGVVQSVTWAILGAGFNGGSYMNYHEDFSSMIMASLSP